MIWLSISLLLCTIFICCTIIILHLSDRAYSNAVGCLEDLCDTLNEKFPGSNLRIVANEGGIRVKGELKYIKKNDD